MTFKEFEATVKKYRSDIETVTPHYTGNVWYSKDADGGRCEHVNSTSSFVTITFKGNNKGFTYTGSYGDILKKLGVKRISQAGYDSAMGEINELKSLLDRVNNGEEIWAVPCVVKYTPDYVESMIKDREDKLKDYIVIPDK